MKTSYALLPEGAKPVCIWKAALQEYEAHHRAACCIGRSPALHPRRWASLHRIQHLHKSGSAADSLCFLTWVRSHQIVLESGSYCFDPEPRIHEQLLIALLIHLIATNIRWHPLRRYRLRLLPKADGSARLLHLFRSEREIPCPWASSQTTNT